MDVEDVVRWACGQELTKKRGAATTKGPAGLNAAGADAALVGRWTRPPGFPAISPMFAGAYGPSGPGRQAGGAPDADALIVEAAILGLGASMGALAVPEALALDIGLAVDVEGAFAAAIANVANLVLAHGRLGNRPAPGSEAPRPRPRPAANGKPGAWRRERWREPTAEGGFVEREVETPVQRLRRDLYPPGAYCLLDYEPDPQLIVNDRAEYLAWRLALDALCAALSGRLERIGALPPAAALAPWLGEKDGDKPRDLFAPGAAGVYSGRERLALAARRESRQRRALSVCGAKMRRAARPGRGAASGGM